MLRDAVRSILAQDYPGNIEVVVVYDKISVDPLHDIEVVEGRTLRTMKNSRTTGLAGEETPEFWQLLERSSGSAMTMTSGCPTSSRGNLSYGT